jgi:hypothetical protein
MACAKECHHFKETGEHVNWSPGYIYGNPACRPEYDGEGMYLDRALNGATKVGFVPEPVFDILEEMPWMKSYVESRTDLPAFGEKRKLQGFVSMNYALETKKVEAMKQALIKYQIPLVVCSYEYFGCGHAFVVYGWDDAWTHKKGKKKEQIFAFRNSWGEEWENGGNSAIPVSYLDQVYLPIFEDMPMPFEDVKETDWFFSDVRAVAFAGLMQGVTDKTFQPDGNLIRGDLALVVQRALSNMMDLSNAFIKTLQQKKVPADEICLQEPGNGTIAFEDVDDDAYYRDAIRMVCANGIMKGADGDMFEPRRSVTRCEMAAIVSRVHEYTLNCLKKAVPSAKLTIEAVPCVAYDDIQESDWYYKYVINAGCLGLMQGDGDGKFRPEETVNRAEAAAVLNRLFRLIDKVLMEVGETA